MTGDARAPDYFDALYAADPDPWRFETSAYERDKYAATLAALPRDRYRRAVEIGCSIGVLTASLGTRCDALLGVDVAQAALDRAAARCAAMPNVRFARMRLPDAAPEGPFDLLMMSEVLYYFDLPTLERLAGVVAAMRSPDADLVLVHWLGPTPDYPLTGDTAADAFIAMTRDWATVTHQSRTPDYRIDVMRAARE